MIKELRNRIEHYLQNDCDDFWHADIEIVGGETVITGKYSGIDRFTLHFDGDEFYISGDCIHIDIIKNIIDITENLVYSYPGVFEERE